MGKEREISLVNLCWEIVENWKKALVIGVVFALLISGYKYVSDYRAYLGNQKKSLLLETPEYQEYLELVNIKERLEEYKKLSFFENVDPLDVYQVEYTYKLNETGDILTDKASALADFYVTSDMIEEFLKNQIKDEVQLELMALQLQDLFEIFVESEYDDEIFETKEAAVYVHVCIYYEEDGEILNTSLTYEDMIKYVEEYYSKKNAQLVKKGIYKTKSNVIDSKSNLDVDNLIAKQDAKIAKFMDENKIVEIPEEIIKPGISLKAMILGFIVGVFLVCLLEFIKAVFTEKLQDPCEIEDYYGIKNTEKLFLNKEKNVLSRRLKSIRYRKSKPLDDAIQMFVANIKAIYGTQSICISSTLMGCVDSEIIQQIKNAFKNENIELVVVDTVISNVDSYKQMNEIGQVLFIEMIDKSRHSDISEAIEKAKNSNVEIVGCLVVS